MKIIETNYICRKRYFRKRKEEHYEHVNKTKIKTDYWSYVLGQRIHGFRNGLYPTTRKIIINLYRMNG